MSLASEILSRSPLAYYKLAESSGTTMVDASGNARDGTYSGTFTLGATALVDSDTSLSLPGSGGGSGAVADAAWMDVNTATIIAVFATSNTGQQRIGGRNAGSGQDWFFVDLQASNGIRAYSTRSTGGVQVVASATVTGLRDNNRHLVVASHDGTNLKLWVDGVLVASAAQAGNLINRGVPLHVGRRGDSGDTASVFNGRLAHFALLGAAVTQTDVDALWASLSPNISISPPAATATATGHAPTISFQRSFTVAAALATATATALAPTISFTRNVTVVAPAATATAAGYAPAISFTRNVTLAPPAGAATATGLEPSVAFSSADDLAVSPPTAGVTAVGLAPTISFTRNVTVVAPAATATAAGYAPAISFTTVADITISAPAAAATTTAYAPTILIGNPPIETDTSNRDDGVEIGDGYAEVFWDPGVTPVPAHLTLGTFRTVARVIDTPPTWDGTKYDLADARTADIEAGVPRVLIDDVDWTYFRGAAVVVENVKLIDPLLYGNARITIPAINPQFPDSELGDLVALFQFARVRIQRVIDGAVIATDHKGFVSRVDTSGTSLGLEIGGQAAGALSQMYVPQPVYRRKQDVEHICVDLLRDARVRAKEHDGESGIGLIKRSGADGLSIFNEYVAVWSGAAGQAVTFTPNADGVYRKTQKATTGIDATAYIDNSLVSQSLAQDFMEQYTRVYAQGFTASGELVANIKTPGLTQGATPDFPLAVAGDWIDLDLSAANLRHYGPNPEDVYGMYDPGAGVIISTDGLESGSSPKFWFDSVDFGSDLAYDETYEFEVTFTPESSWTLVYVEAHATTADSSYNLGPTQYLMEEAGDAGPPPSVVTFTIGPGIEGWDAAVAGGYVGTTFEITNSGAVSAMRYRVAGAGGAETLAFGMTDADTTSGAGVTAVQQQLAIHDFLDFDDVTAGTYDETTTSAVMAFQAVAGLNVTGEVGPNAWDALWDLASIGYSLDEAREYPTAQDSRTFKWFRTANGSKIRENPDYDPHFIPNDIFFDAGGPFGKGHIQAFAESKLAPEGGVWTGTLTFRSGFFWGDVSPGDPIDSSMVADRRDGLPNMRMRLPWFGGAEAGIVVYLNGWDHGLEESTALASTVPMTTMETWQAIERRREAKSNPGRSWSGHTRASQVRNDLGVSWDTSSGWIANKVALTAGWNEIKVPAGQEGIVQRIRIQLEDAAEFACLLTQKPVSTDALDNNTHTGTPLTDPRPSDRPWWEKEDVVDWLEARGYLNAWGTENQPCGYDPSLKTDELGPTAQAITGLFHEQAGFNYATGVEPVLYLYLWVGSTNALMPGRILRNQRTTDF